MKTPYLTKSRYIDGLRCEKKLWLGWHQRLPYEEALPFSVLIDPQGQIVARHWGELSEADLEQWLAQVPAATD